MRLDGFDLPLVTERLLLRRFAEGDFAAYADRRGRADVYRYLLEPVPGPEALREKFDAALAGPFACDGDALRLTVALRDGGTILGDVMLKIASLQSRQAEIGYVFHPGHGGKGYATEAVRALIGFGFAQAGFHRIFARLDAANKGSVGAMERLGLRREALFLQNDFSNGEWSDEAVYALLRTEWQAR